MLEGEVELVCILFIFKISKDIVPLSSTKKTPLPKGSKATLLLSLFLKEI
jgi:hypothetical protein